MALMQRAAEQAGPDQVGSVPLESQEEGDGGEFQRHDIAAKVPPEMKDAFERTVAAGMKVMYSPEMRQDVMAEVQREAPVVQKLAESTTGLLLMLDSKSKGGIPEQVIYLAGMELLGEAAEVLVKAGQPVTQEDYNDALNAMFVLIDQKRGVDPKSTMQSATQAVGQTGQPEGEQPEQAEPEPEDDDWKD